MATVNHNLPDFVARQILQFLIIVIISAQILAIPQALCKVLHIHYLAQSSQLPYSGNWHLHFITKKLQPGEVKATDPKSKRWWIWDKAQEVQPHSRSFNSYRNCGP